MARITVLMEERQLYKRKGLTLSDLAAELATNKTYVSALLNTLSGEKFTSILTRYRVEYAQRLMREHPEMHLDDVADESGFSSRTTFFRSFKALTGMTPQEFAAEERMQFAVRLLRDSFQSCEEIAEQTGYSSAVSFNRAFRRRFGYSPMQYRKSQMRNLPRNEDS